MVSPAYNSLQFWNCNNYIVSTYMCSCPDARERTGPVFPPPPPVGEEETQAQRARARRGNMCSTNSAFNSNFTMQFASTIHAAVSIV